MVPPRAFTLRIIRSHFGNTLFRRNACLGERRSLIKAGTGFPPNSNARESSSAFIKSVLTHLLKMCVFSFASNCTRTLQKPASRGLLLHFEHRM